MHTASTRPGGSRRRATPPWRRRRHLRWALCCALLLAAASSFVTGRPDAETVLTAAADLPAGHHLTADDLALTTLPGGATPDGALSGTDAALGAGLTSPVRRGEVLTDARLSGAAGSPERADTRVVPVPVGDGGLADHVATGMRVDVVIAPTGRAADTPRPAESPAVLARDAIVVDVTAASVGSGATLLLRLPTRSAATVAARALDTPLTVTVHG